jgi:hypothetical protein
VRDARSRKAPHKTQKISWPSCPSGFPLSGSFQSCEVRAMRFRNAIPYIGSTAAVLTYMSERTSHLDVADMVKTLETLPQSPDLSLDIHGVQGVYAILRYTPMEYLPKSVRIDLTKKAIVFDGQLMSMSKREPPEGHLTGVLSLSREYISRSLAQSVVFDRPVRCHSLSLGSGLSPSRKRMQSRSTSSTRGGAPPQTTQHFLAQQRKR